MKARYSIWLWILGITVSLSLNAHSRAADEKEAVNTSVETVKMIGKLKVKAFDWPQWGGTYHRNNTPVGKNISTDWDVKMGKDIKWTAQLGSQTYGNPVIANGKVYVGTNNGAGHIARYPATIDLGCLLCFDEATGKFLWQHSSEKLPTGRVHDWPMQGICCAPYVEGDRLWFVTSRGEVVCLDTEGFYDGENDGPFKDEKPKPAAKPGDAKPAAAAKAADKKPDPASLWDEKHEADVVWKLNMMSELRVSQHNMCSCSVTCAGDILFVNTSNGVNEAHISLPQANAPSFLALDRKTGKVLWTDNSPGANVLHGQWSSPTYGEFKDGPQVLFGAGDGWLYSFDPKGDGKGKSKLLWKFDCNPKESKYSLGGRATRNHLIATPVVYNGLVFVGVGEDPEHGEGVGHLWCIDPSKRGDVSPELVFNAKDPATPIPHKRLQACEKDKGDFTKPNPNSAAVWHYSVVDVNKNGKTEFEETMHRTCGTVAIKSGLLFVADFSGLFHCLDVKTGEPYWTHDMLAASWASPLIVEDHVYIGDEDGDITIFDLNKEKSVVAELSMETSVYTTPVVGNNVLYIANKDQLFAIETGFKGKPAGPKAQAAAAADE